MLRSSEQILISRLACKCTFSDFFRTELNFNLADYRNSFFTSNDPNKIIDFYYGFEDRDELIQWMKERPKGVANIYEIEGDRDIVVVIPTADFSGDYAKECRENIFKGLHMVFVESGGKEDFYFNYAHNCNMGIKKAMEYNPKWIVISNDDMIYHSSSLFLLSELNDIDNTKIDCVFAKPTSYHSYLTFIARIRPQYLVRLMVSKNKDYGKLLKKFSVKYNASPKRQRIFDELYQILYFKRLHGLYQIGSFGIISGFYLQSIKDNLFDETFINYYEDLDVSLRFFRSPQRIAFINYLIEDIIGGTIGKGYLRMLRSFASLVYLNNKLKFKNRV